MASFLKTLRACALAGAVWSHDLGTFAAQYVVNPEFEDVGADGVAPGWERAGKPFSIRKGEGFNGTRGLVYENDDPSCYCFPFQKLPLKPGGRYLVTARIRTENIQGKDIGAGVCVEFTAGGAYSKGFKGTTDGWIPVAFTADVPARASAASIEVAPFVRRGCTGKAWFDDLTVTDLARPPIEAFSSSAYRNSAADGEVSFVAVLNLGNAADAKGLFAVRHGDRIRTYAPDELTADRAILRLKVADLPVGASDVAFRLSDAQGETIAKKKLGFVRTTGKDARRVRFDSRGRTIVDGKPFFPIGLCIDQRDKTCFDVIAKGPFNCVAGGESTDYPGMYDDCAARGLMVIADVHRMYADIGRQGPYASVREAEAALTDWVTRYRNHPAILAWSIADEFPAHLAPVLEARRKLMERLDPDHPTYVCTCHPEDARHSFAAFEAVACDPYPIGNTKGYDINQVADWVKLLREGTFRARPLWHTAQIFDWAAHRANSPGARAPTYDEMRSMTWQAIAEGVNGIKFYAYMSLKWANKRDPFEKRWAEVCRVAEEVKAHVPGLLSDEPPPKLGTLPAGLSARGWTLNGVRTVVLANQRRTELRGALEIDGRKINFLLPPLGVSFLDVTPPTHAAVKYGPDPAQAFDLWLPKDVPAGTKTPLVIDIHGGSWLRGDRFAGVPPLLALCTRAKVAFASLSYRLIDAAEAQGVKPPVKACLEDAESAVRFLQAHADEWNLDTSRIALSGSSAGACSSLIASLRNDCALGIKCVYARNPQTSLDPQEMREWIPNIAYGHRAFGYATFDDWFAHRAECREDILRYSPAELARRCTPAKAPRIIYLASPIPATGLPKDPTHAGMFCRKFEEICRARGMSCRGVSRKRPDPDYLRGGGTWGERGFNELLNELLH